MLTDDTPAVPQDLHAEQAVLGCAMLNTDIARSIRAIVNPRHFYRDAHRHIYEAICGALDAVDAVDLVPVASQLRKRNLLDEVGGAEYLLALTSGVPTTHHWRAYVQAVCDCGTRRQVLNWTSGIDILARTDTSTQDLIAEIINGGMGLAEDAKFAKVSRVGEHYDGDMATLQDNLFADEAVTPARWGIDKLDKATGGLGNFYLTLVMAGPGVGKTRLVNHAVMSSMEQFMQQPEPPAILVFPLEEGHRSWIRNALAWQAQIDSRWLLRGQCPDYERDRVHKEIAEAYPALCKCPFLIGEDVASGAELVGRIRVETRKRRVGLIVVDYLQRLARSAENERQQLGQIAIDLQTIAEELSVPIVLLSQMSTSGTTGELLPYGGRGPQFDASLVVLIERDYKDKVPQATGTLTCLKSRGVPEFSAVNYRVEYGKGARYYEIDTYDHEQRDAETDGRRWQ